MSYPPHKEIYYLENDIPHPRNLGFQEDLGEPIGQIADYRLALENGISIHARDYGEEIGFHWDEVDPRVDWFEHLRRDSPYWYTAVCSLGGACLGVLATVPSQKKEVIIKSSIICGFLGFLVGFFTAEWK